MIILTSSRHIFRKLPSSLLCFWTFEFSKTPVCPLPPPTWYCVLVAEGVLCSKTQYKELSTSTVYKNWQNRSTASCPVYRDAALNPLSFIRDVSVLCIHRPAQALNISFVCLFVFALYFSSLLVGFFYSGCFYVGVGSISFLVWHSLLYSILLILYLLHGNFLLCGLHSCFHSVGPLFDSRPLVFVSHTHTHVYIYIYINVAYHSGRAV
jgi:hypothetical protein